MERIAKILRHDLTKHFLYTLFIVGVAVSHDKFMPDIEKIFGSVKF